MKKVFIFVLLSSVLVGCSDNAKVENAECSDIIQLHKNNKLISVNKNDIVLIEAHGDGTSINFNTELEEVNGMSRGNAMVFDESQEEVNNLIQCK
jgi:uncharacterized protein YcfL